MSEIDIDEAQVELNQSDAAELKKGSCVLKQANGGGLEVVDFTVVDGRAIFEGDIDLGDAEVLDVSNEAFSDSDGEMHASVVAITARIWPDGMLPFEPVLASSVLHDRITAAMNEIATFTTVQFREKQAVDVDYIEFQLSSHCSSRVGRVGGKQVIRLNESCSVGNVVHELCHALGMWHEQSRNDRDNFIRVNWHNILPGFDHNFKRRTNDGHDIGQYDYASIMHYPPNAFTRNGNPTIEATQGSPELGQRRGLSDGDAEALRQLYDFDNIPDQKIEVQTSAHNGVQFRVHLSSRETQNIVTRNWSNKSTVFWQMVCVDPNNSSEPVIEWSEKLGSSKKGHTDYYFTIKNLAYSPTTIEARYKII